MTDLYNSPIDIQESVKAVPCRELFVHLWFISYKKNIAIVTNKVQFKHPNLLSTPPKKKILEPQKGLINSTHKK